MPTKYLQRILACAEGAMTAAAEDSDVLSFGSGSILRDAGTRAVGAYEGPRTSYGWPPDDHLVDIPLEDQEWVWVFKQLEQWGTMDASTVETMQFLVDALGGRPSSQ